MDDSKKHVVQFLQKEINTYKALARFLAKKGIEERAESRQQRRCSLTPRSTRNG